MEVALDLALQCSPDHPWVKEHPEWFTTRADGSIAYAENPPKKYQDIYPLNFDNDPEGIYARGPAGRPALDGPRRADLPGRQPAHQAGRVLGAAARRRSRQTDPDVLFLAEAFTRPAMMRHARQGRLPPVLHLLHLAQQQGRARASTSASCPVRPPPTCGRTSSSTRRTSCTSTCSTAGRRRSRSGPCSPRCSAPTWGIYSGYRAVREHAGAPGQRGVPGLREVPVPAAGLGRGRAREAGAGAVHHDLNLSGERIRRCTGCVTYGSITSTSQS